MTYWIFTNKLEVFMPLLKMGNNSSVFHNHDIQNCIYLFFWPDTLTQAPFFYLSTRIISFVQNRDSQCILMEGIMHEGRRNGQNYTVWSLFVVSICFCHSQNSQFDNWMAQWWWCLLMLNCDSVSLEYDKSINFHTYYNKGMFVGATSPLSNQKVATIGGRKLDPSGIGIDFGHSTMTVVFSILPWSIMSSISLIHQSYIEHCQFCLATQLQMGTGINPKQKKSRLCSIIYPESNLPKMAINNGFSIFTNVWKAVYKGINPSVNSNFSCHLLQSL